MPLARRGEYQPDAPLIGLPLCFLWLLPGHYGMMHTMTCYEDASI